MKSLRQEILVWSLIVSTLATTGVWGQLFNMPSQQSKLLFKLPEELSTGSHALFPNAVSRKEIPYTQQNSILLFGYANTEAAREDLNEFAKHETPVNEEQSPELSGSGACFQRNDQDVTLWFPVGSDVLGLRVSAEQAATERLLKIAEGLLADYEDFVGKHYATPEMCLRTFVEAVSDADVKVAVNSLYNDGSPEALFAIRRVEQSIFILPIVEKSLLQDDNQEQTLNIQKKTAVSPTEVVLHVQPVAKSAAIFVLNTAWGGPADQKGPASIPFRKTSQGWRIDVVSLQKDFSSLGAREKAQRLNDAANLKQIGLALRMYSSDHQEKFPDNLAELWEQNYLSHGKVFISPRSDTEPPETAAELRAGQTDYIYFGKGGTEDVIGSQDPIAVTKPGIFSDGFVNVLYGDGHVKGHETMPEDVEKLMPQHSK